MIGADIYPKRHSLIASIATAAILFVYCLLYFSDTITSLYERFIGVSPTPASNNAKFPNYYTATPIPPRKRLHSKQNNKHLVRQLEMYIYGLTKMKKS